MTERKAPINKWRLSQAAESMSTLRKVINDLTFEEVIAALDLEARSMRRKTNTDRLIARATRLNEIEFSNQLRKKYHGQSHSR